MNKTRVVNCNTIFFLWNAGSSYNSIPTVLCGVKATKCLGASGLQPYILYYIAKKKKKKKKEQKNSVLFNERSLVVGFLMSVVVDRVKRNM